MLLEVMRETRNFFECSAEYGKFSLSGGKISLVNEYKAGQYILLTGSVLVDGVYRISAAKNGKYTLDGAEVNENWTGVVYGLAVPQEFVRLCGEIREFQQKNSDSNIVSETVLGVHSWAKGTDKSGAPLGWQRVFADRLNPYRRMFGGVEI
jgi:hypothetical protein